MRKKLDDLLLWADRAWLSRSTKESNLSGQCQREWQLKIEGRGGMGADGQNDKQQATEQA